MPTRQVAPVRLGQRIVLARSLLAGQVAQETEPGGRAAQEIAAVHAFIACTLERSRHPARPARTRCRGGGYPNSAIDSTNRTRSTCREIGSFW